MRICIVGAGAIGGYVGAKLALAGEQITLIARGAHLAAIKQNGLKLVMSDGSEHIAAGVKATSRMQEAGPQDLVIIALKAHQIEPVVNDIRSLFHDQTIVVTMQNGIPWWYFQKHPGPLEGNVLRAVDPNGVLTAGIEPGRIIGCVVYPATEIAAPGVIRHIEGDRFPVGELDGTESERVKTVSETFTRAGLKSPVLPSIRSEIWLKLWGNLTFNPISALTHSTLVDICRFPLTRHLAAMMMTEAQAIAHKLGIEFRVSLEKRIAGAEKVGKHKTSMLQDVEAGRPVEIDALVGAVVELGQLTGTPTPYIDAVYSCVKLLAKTMGEEQLKVKAQKAA